MIARIFDGTGLVVMYLEGSLAQVELNVPPGGSYEEVEGVTSVAECPPAPPPVVRQPQEPCP